MTVTNKSQLTEVVLNTLTPQPQTIVDISKEVFLSSGLSPADDMFYTYQYDMRWSLMQLVDTGVAERGTQGRKSVYSLSA